jgi:hypothetical protein
LLDAVSQRTDNVDGNGTPESLLTGERVPGTATAVLTDIVLHFNALALSSRSAGTVASSIGSAVLGVLATTTARLTNVGIAVLAGFEVGTALALTPNGSRGLLAKEATAAVRAVVGANSTLAGLTVLGEWGDAVAWAAHATDAGLEADEVATAGGTLGTVAADLAYTATRGNDGCGIIGGDVDGFVEGFDRGRKRGSNKSKGNQKSKAEHGERVGSNQRQVQKVEKRWWKKFTRSARPRLL